MEKAYEYTVCVCAPHRSGCAKQKKKEFHTQHRFWLFIWVMFGRILRLNLYFESMDKK